MILLKQKQFSENIWRRVVHQNSILNSPSNILCICDSFQVYFQKSDRSRWQWWSWTARMNGFTLPMLRLLSSNAQERKIFRKPSKSCHVGTHLKALAEYSQMSTHLSRFQSFFGFLHRFVLAKLATSSIRVKWVYLLQILREHQWDKTWG